MPTVVNYILQDKTGFLWFATNSGLYKYDGYNFTSYKHDIDDTASLVDNTLTTLYEDREGILWIGTWIGIVKFDPAANIFTYYRPGPSEAGNAANNVWAICEDKYGVLWIGTGNGLFKFNKITGKFTSLKYDSNNPGSISHNSFNAIYRDKEGELWFGTDVGLDKLDHKTGRFIHYWSDPARKQIKYYDVSKYWVGSILSCEPGPMWLGTNNGLLELNLTTGKSIQYLHSTGGIVNHITSICEDIASGSIWTASWEGLFLFDRNSKEFIKFNSGTNFVLSERSGSLWLGTDSEIKKLNRIKQPFRKYRMNDVACVIRGFGNEDIVWKKLLLLK